MVLPIPDVDQNTLRLMRRMTAPPASHAHFVGEAVDMSAVDGLALGDLWTLAHATEKHADHRPLQSLAAETARAILALKDSREPIFRGAACRDWLDLVANDAEAKPEREPSDFGAIWPLQRACFALTRCVDLRFEGLRPAAERLLAATHWQAMPHLAVALARLIDTACEKRVLDRLASDLAASPLLVDEVRALRELDLAKTLVVADVAYPDRVRDNIDDTKATRRLSAFPCYATIAKAGLMKAAERIREIHALARPYAADKAFTLHESAVVARQARVVLDRDEPWLAPVLDELFRKVSLAPTAARTVPSQSLSIALGHAVEAFPTPEAVATMRRVLRDIRHAGVKQKLQRNVRGAERGLAARPAIALRLPPDQPLTKAQLKALAHSLEAGFETSLRFSYEEWRARLAEHEKVKALTTSLVWRIVNASNAISVLPVAAKSGLLLQDVHGAAVIADAGCDVALWHPSEADGAEREAWRSRIMTLRLAQPFKQVFREHYALPFGDLSQSETTMFAGHAVSIRPFLGLARRQGWRLEYDCLVRLVGDVRVVLVLADRIWPGARGWTVIQKISVWRSVSRRHQPAAFEDLTVTARSEVLRSVDLLVSTSGFALEPADAGAPDDPSRDKRLRDLAVLPLGPMAEMRRDALARALAGREGMETLSFDARHLRLGRYAIHLATGRVTRDGDPVTVDLPKRSAIAAVPWLPYDERLLEQIAVAALQIGLAPPA